MINLIKKYWCWAFHDDAESYYLGNGCTFHRCMTCGRVWKSWEDEQLKELRKIS